jgi:hypothetical protein
VIEILGPALVGLTWAIMQEIRKSREPQSCVWDDHRRFELKLRDRECCKAMLDDHLK